MNLDGIKDAFIYLTNEAVFFLLAIGIFFICTTYWGAIGMLGAWHWRLLHVSSGGGNRGQKTKRMSDKPRRFWQIHLQTALLVFATGSILLVPAAWLVAEATNPTNIGYPDWLPRDDCLFALAVYIPAVLATLTAIGYACEVRSRRRSKP